MRIESHNMTLTDTLAIVDNGHQLYRRIESQIRSYLPEVTAELRTIADCRESDPIRHAQECLVFAILSPGCKFDYNVLMVRRFMDAIDEGKSFPDCDSLYRTIAMGVSGRGVGRNVRNLFHSLDAVLNITPDDMTKPGLLAWRKSRYVLGIGEKTAAMAVALYDEHSPVVTLDVHMLRWLAEECLHLTASRHTIADDAYRTVEAWFLQWVARYFDEYSPFAIQWAIWDARRGEHEAHAPIFGVDVKTI